MAEDYTSLLASLGVQSFPTEQPVQAVPYNDYAPLNLGNWSISTMQGLMNNPAFSTNAVNQYIADQAAAGNEVVSVNPYASSTGVGPDSINANIWNALNQFNPANPSATTAQVYRLDTGNDIGVPGVNGGFTYQNAGPVAYRPGETYTMTDNTGKVIGTASNAQEMQKLVELSQSSPAYTLQRTEDPYGADTLGGMLPSKTDAGSLESMLLNMAALAAPAAGGSILGPWLASTLGTGAAVGTGLGTALGTAAVGTAAGKSLEDILLRSALSGLAAGGLSALLKPGVPSTTVDPVAEYIKALTGVDIPSSVFGGFSGGFGSGSIAGTDAGGNFIQVMGGAGSRLPVSFLGGALGAASNALSGYNYGNQVWGEQPTNPNDTNEIVAEGRPIFDENGIPIGYGPTITAEGAPQTNVDNRTAVLPEFYPPLTSVNIPPLAGTEFPQIPTDNAEQPGWTVNAPKPIRDIALPGIPITSVNIPPGAGTKLPSTGNSTLDQIMKYYTLGSGLLDLLGGSGGGSGARQTTPSSAYGSLLGGVPNFGRGAFTPFTGDYEKYAFGPEWNFFGGAPTSTPTNG